MSTRSLIEAIDTKGVWSKDLDRVLQAAKMRRTVQAPIPKQTPERTLREFVQDAWHVIEPGVKYVPGWHVDAICDHLEACSKQEIRNLVINMPPRCMKPVAGTTEVLMGNGNYKAIKDIVVGDLVITHRGRARRVEGVAHQGLLPCLTITTEHTSVVAAYDHPFLTPAGWVEAGQLQENGLLAYLDRIDGRGDFKPEVITSLESCGDHDCYCISVEEDHSYTVNKLICHNSTLISVLWFCWSWTWNPYSRWIYSSYASNLSTRDSIKCRRLIDSPWFQKEYGHVFRLTSDQNAKTRFDNDKMGMRLATTVSGGGTGEGGDFIVCLDGKTLIETDHGPLPIEEVVNRKMGVKVWSYNHETGERELDEIEEWEKSPGRHCVEIHTLETDLRCTFDHPVWWQEEGFYVPAIELHRKALLLGFDGQEKEVIAMSECETPQFVYNIRVKKNHNYFASGVLVHNCDDPHKVQEGNSALKKDSIADWWFETMSTRGNDPETVVKLVVMQRVSEDDLSGRILARQLGYDHLILPMYFEDTDEARSRITSIGFVDPRQEDGDLLWPQRFKGKDLEDLTRQIGPYGEAGQFQQRPSPRGGGLMKRANFDIFDRSPGTGWRIRCWDLAASKDGDYTVGARVLMHEISKDEMVFFLEDIVRIREEPGERDQVIYQTAQRDGKGVPIFFETEGGSAGKSVVHNFIQKLRGWTVMGEKPTGPKEARASNLISYATVRMIKLVNGEWVENFLSEVELFPAGKHDDQVDATAYAVNKLLAGYGSKVGSVMANGGGFLPMSDVHLQAQSVHANPITRNPLIPTESPALPVGIPSGIKQVLEGTGTMTPEEARIGLDEIIAKELVGKGKKTSEDWSSDVDYSGSDKVEVKQLETFSQSASMGTIRDTGVSVFAVLELVREGRSSGVIREKFPQIQTADIDLLRAAVRDGLM